MRAGKLVARSKARAVARIKTTTARRITIADGFCLRSISRTKKHHTTGKKFGVRKKWRHRQDNVYKNYSPPHPLDTKGCCSPQNNPKKSEGKSPSSGRLFKIE